MNKLAISCILSLFSLSAFSQVNRPPRPRLVVGIMVDQMRWDYLYRFQDRFVANGFRRMLDQGYSCDNTLIPYAQTVTAAGHTCVYTGSVPSIHGIMGNEWYDRRLGRDVYCAEDSSVKLVGVDKGEPMSPANLWTTTICDELRLATNFRSKVIGVAIKDRGSILPAGHSANAAYWYDGTSGKWITSTYYMQQLPKWVDAFNDKKWVDSFYDRNWNTLFPIDTYVQSDEDNVPYEGKSSGDKAPVFPHELRSFMGKNYGMIRATPYGNTLTLKFAESALSAEGLGKDNITDFLAVSISSPDYIGHQYGPNSVEIEDNYLRLDRDLAAFFDYLDKTVGRGQYLVFLTADHAVAHTPGFLNKQRIPGESVSFNSLGLTRKIEERFHVKQPVLASANYQIYLNDSAIRAAGADMEELKQFIIDEMNKRPEVLLAWDAKRMHDANLPASIREMFINGYNTERGGDIQIIPKAGYFYGGKTGTTHGSMYPYDAHIPLLWYGWHIKPGHSHQQVYMTDIAPTLAALLQIQMPSGAIGKPIAAIAQ